MNRSVIKRIAAGCCFFFIFASFFFFLWPFFSGGGQAAEASVKRILVGSPIRQKPEILSQFLDSFARQERLGYRLDYYFVDDNSSEESRRLLRNFSPSKGERVFIIAGSDMQKTDYVCTEITHQWNEDLVWKVARFKDSIIQYAKDQNYDFLFLIDSDIVLHPKTIDQLMAAKKNIVSNIFWTKWGPNMSMLPQVWLLDQYTLYRHNIGERLSQAEIDTRQAEFLQGLHQPGTYPVGGLGACTLIDAEALQRGVSFKRIPNITLWGEDRHFCVRAAASGLDLYVDTHYPAYHIYRESELAGVDAFITSCK